MAREGIVARAKAALRLRLKVPMDHRGYVASAAENLIAGVDARLIEADIRRGAGDELSNKFKAVHSSSALAVNCFGLFKTDPQACVVLGRLGALAVEFEKRLPIFRGGTPHLDVWIERDADPIAVESKCLEYLTPKRPQFSEAYERLAPPHCEPCWWRLYREARTAGAQHLDQAQLLKHYFGANTFTRKRTGRRPTLLYLFWEPMNWMDIPECVCHRQELDRFSKAVVGAELPFQWMPYSKLWDEWSQEPHLRTHVERLRARYEVTVRARSEPPESSDGRGLTLLCHLRSGAFRRKLSSMPSSRRLCRM